MSYKNYTYLVVILLVVGGLSFFAKKGETPVQIEEEPAEIVQDAPSEEIVKPVSAPAPTYQELITSGHALYLKGQYIQALPYFQKAALLEQNDRIYRSLYSVYLGLKDYQNAEMAMKKALIADSRIVSNWVEYASFENNYVKASFDIVSKIYLEGLKDTKDNIDLLTNYAAYLTENKKYAEAITYLEKAITINPARKAVFQAEIENLRGKI